MRLTLSVEGPAAAADLAAALLSADPPINAEPIPDGTYAVHIGLSGVAPLFNMVTHFVVHQPAGVAVVIRGEPGQEARIDRRAATDPFEILMAVNLFNPPVGLG